MHNLAQFEGETHNDLRLEKAREVLRLLSEMLEESAFDMAGHVESTQVSHALSLAHQLTGLSQRLRSRTL